MSWSASIRIVDSDGDPRSGVEVTLFFSGFTHLSEYTDDSGWAEFEIDADVHSNQVVTSIHAGGEEVGGSMMIDDGDTLSFST